MVETLKRRRIRKKLGFKTELLIGIAHDRIVFLGMSYEQAFLNGLNVQELKEHFNYLYSLLKA